MVGLLGLLVVGNVQTEVGVARCLKTEVGH